MCRVCAFVYLCCYIQKRSKEWADKMQAKWAAEANTRQQHEKKSLCVRQKEREKKTDENIWKSDSNNKSLQVNEVDCILRLAKLCAPRDWNVNTCSFFALAPLFLFLHSWLWCCCFFCFIVWCALIFFALLSTEVLVHVDFTCNRNSINRLKAISWGYVQTKNGPQK